MVIAKRRILTIATCAYKTSTSSGYFVTIHAPGFFTIAGPPATFGWQKKLQHNSARACVLQEIMAEALQTSLAFLVATSEVATRPFP